MKKLVLPALLFLLIAGFCAAQPFVRLQRATFDPVSGLPALPPGLEKSDAAADGSRYYIIQFSGPIQDSWKAEAAAAGAELLDYIPDFAFVARAKETAEARLRALPSVRWVGDFAPAYRLSDRLPKDGTADVVIRVFPGADESHVLVRIAGAGGRLAAPAAKGTRSVRASIPAAALARIARTAGVAWIEPFVERKLVNDVARSVTTVNQAWDLSLGVFAAGLFGSGQIAAVADTGLDVGVNDSTLSADFRGRLLKAYSLGRHNDWSDNYGHGTHVAGTVLGNGSLSGSIPASHIYAASFAGAAPEASLVFQSVADRNGNLTGIPADLNQLYDPPYQDGARVHSNSWGSVVNGQYDIDSYNTDLYTWNHKDMVICFAAGNEGVDKSPSDGFVDPDSMDSPATAKNCISVGATENPRTTGATGTYGNYWPSDYPTNPIYSDPVSNNPRGMAAFSSRGPTDDGRFKPDICAPGTNIISCRSHDPQAKTTWSWGVYNNDYLYAGGTSMATPHIAGACTVTRQYYAGQGISPSAALVKATLINGAFDMTPGQYASPQETPVRPNNVEGWGRLDLRNSLLPASPRLVYPFDASPGLSTGGSATYSFYVVSNAAPMRVTLAWTDYPGTTGAAKELVNDLDLTVTGPSGTFRGNGATDRKNNVEGVDIVSPQAGAYTITVSAYNVAHGPQPYALIVSGPLTTAQPSSHGTVAAAKALPDGSVIAFSGKLVTAGTDLFKGRFYIQELDRSSGIRVDYGPGGGPVVTTGSTVNVTGTLTTAAGERVIKNPIVTM